MNTFHASSIALAVGLEWLYRRGLSVTLSEDGERLSLMGPTKARNDRIRAFLREHKPELLALLRAVNGDFDAALAEVQYHEALRKAAELDASGEPVPYPGPAPPDRTLTYEEWTTQYLPRILHRIEPEQRPESLACLDERNPIP